MKKISFILALCAAALVSCNKGLDRADQAVVLGDNSQIVFTMNDIATRASVVTANGADNTVALTSFNVVATSGSETETSVWTDGAFSGTYGGNFTGGKYWPSESVSWNFYASNAAMVMPSSGDFAGKVIINVADCGTDVVAERLASATYKASNALTFDHILSQVGTVTMKAPATYAISNLKVSLQPIVAGTYDMKANTWTAGSPSAAYYIVGSASQGVSIAADSYHLSDDNDLWLLPGTYQLTASYTISKGDFSKAYTKQATVTLAQGMNNNLGLANATPNVPGSGDPNIPGPGSDIQELVFTVSVTAWGSQDIPAEFGD